MNKKNLKLWYLSVASFGVCIFPFVVFMFTAKLQHMLIALAFIGAAAVFYIIMTRKLTHPQYGYTAFHAVEFYDRCIKAGLNSVSECRHNAEEFKAIGMAYEHTAKFDYKLLLEVFASGEAIRKE